MKSILTILVLLIYSFSQSQEFETIQIGSQVWMKENLNIEIPGSFCYEQDLSKCRVYGRLYNWNTANEACPKGFRLPSDEDWNVLTGFLGGIDSAGVSLRDGGDSGFDAILGGNYSKTLNIYSYADRHGYYWTSTPYSSTAAWMRQFGNHQQNINRSTVKKEYYFSVRCIKE